MERTLRPLLALDPLDAAEYLAEEEGIALELVAPAPRPEVVPLARHESRGLLASVTTRNQDSLGRAALRELDDRVRRVLLWAEEHHEPKKGPFRGFARFLVSRTEANFFKEFSAARLSRERIDQVVRDAALRDNKALFHYLEHADSMLKRLQRAGFFTWAPGYAKGSREALDEFRAGARERLLEIVREVGTFERFEKKPGVEVTFVVFSRYRTYLRKSRRIFEVVDPEVYTSGITTEDLVAERVHAVAVREFIARAASRLTDYRLRFWLNGFIADIDAHGKLNLARVAEKLNRNRSSAVRAFASIAAAFNEQRVAEGYEIF